MKRLAPVVGHVHFHARWISRRAWPFIAGITIFFALLAGILRLWLPSVEAFRPDIEHWLSDTLKHPVSIGALASGWRGWAPELVVYDVDLLDSRHGEPVMHFDDAHIRLDILSSLVNLRPVPSRLSVSGARFSLVRDGNGRVRLQGIERPVRFNLAASFFADGALEVRRAEVIWEDKSTDGAPIKLRDVSVSLRNDGDRHQLDGEAILPGPEAQRIRFALDLTGDPLGGEWDADIYLKAGALPLEPLPFFDLHPEISVSSGRADVEVWSTWRAARLATAETKFDLVALQSSLGNQSFPLKRAAGLLSYRREGEKWQLAVDRLQLITSRGRWKQDDMEITFAGNEVSRIIGGRLSYLELEDTLPAVLAVAPVDARLKEWLKLSRPSGEVRDLAFLYRPDEPSANRLLLKARLDAVDADPHQKHPGFQGLSGSLLVHGFDGKFKLDSDSLVASFPTVFARPIAADTALGGLAWSKSDNGWRVVIESLEISNPDIRIQLAGTLDWAEEDPSPSLNIVARFEDGNVEAMPRYLPVHIMPRRAAAWLLEAIPSGRLESGNLLLRGRAHDFPFDRSEGRFEARANLTDAIVQYAPHWPRIEELNAELVFEGRSLNVYAPEGKVFEADVAEANAHIPDVTSKRSIVLIQGQVRSSSSDGLRFLLESPLEKKFRSALGDAKVTGDVVVGVDLGIALSRKDPHRVEGSITFSGNDVLVRAAGLELEELDGTLQFDHNSITGKGLSARVHGIPIALTVENIDTPELTGTRFVAKSRVSAGQLLGFLTEDESDTQRAKQTLAQRIYGETEFRVALDVPEEVGKKGTFSTLLLESNLRGITLDFPRPLGKEASEARRLILGATPGLGKEDKVRLGYGNDLRAVLAIRRHDGQTKLSRGAIYLGQARGELPLTEGLHVFADLDRFSSTEWLEVFYQGEEAPTATFSAASSPDRPPFLQHIDVKARRFELIGQWTEDLRMTATRSNGGGWLARVKGSTLSGTLVIPGKGDAGRVTMDFDRLSLDAPERDTPTTEGQDPSTLPPLEFRCHDFNFSDISLGSVTLVTRPQAGGLRIERLSMIGDGFQIEATGDWWFNQDEHVSRFKIHVTSPNQGKLLRTFGYDDVVLEGGAVEVIIDANWKGSPGEFSLERINGLLTYRATNGRLVEVEPGQAGRIFGLLSLQALPRRLKLDFSDAFDKGFAYDRVEGSFTVHNGDAYTNDFYMLAPAARIDVAGRVGLASQDYDQLVTVTPEVSSTFAIGGAIAGGPLGAAAAFIAQQVFKGQIGKTIERQYSVSGSWDNPVIVRLEKPVPDFDDEGAEG